MLLASWGKLAQASPSLSRSLSGARPVCWGQQLQASRRAHLSSAMAVATASYEHSPLEVLRVPMLTDNYGWILRDKETDLTAIVDPGEAAPIKQALKDKDWKLDFIINTHHHDDHTGGNQALKAEFGSVVVGPKADESRIPGIDIAVAEGDIFKLGNIEFQVYDTPGHTRGHCTYWAPTAEALFPGDTLFAMGCGRLFEGTAPQMWHSLSKLLQLPPSTQVFCAHEYTQSNARWAIAVDPENVDLQARVADVNDKRSKGVATIPSQFGEELKTNPFLRPDAAGIRKALNIPADATNEDAFGVIRRHKDKF